MGRVTLVKPAVAKRRGRRPQSRLCQKSFKRRRLDSKRGNRPRLASVASPDRPRQVRFDLLAPQAGSVYVAGSFNNWNPQANPLRPARAGRWRLPMRLPAGRYEYRFLVDGRWVPDPAARHQVTNFCGALNSVLLVE